MRVSRVYIDLALSPESEIELPEKTSHYLLQVLRLKTGSRLVLFNGNGFEYPSELIRTGKRSATARTEQPSPKENPPELQIQLAIGLSKGDRFDYAIQKATELGVTTITPLLTEHTAVKLSTERLMKKSDHWQGIITSACEQSGRCYVPGLNPVTTLTDWLPGQSDSLKIILAPEASNSLQQFPPPSSLTMLIGPEGGFSKNEITLAQQFHFDTVRLGNHVLRTETAPVAAIAAVQTLWGDFQ